ncbi:MAG: MerR family transcriptional regulator [Clostridiales bacterium GWF2_36_10]|nr:MAG: MerR family transcriptional regulator [Clostridiales bacterium GWF2_36_10]HAN20345.1 MerR family transcriptional regulator [Clostridiales bacterium]
MDLMTISEVSRSFDVSTRTLRYYEQIGLLTSQKKDDYAYRIYNEAAVRRLQQIILLRKLRIPLKQISSIFKNDEQTHIVEVFQESISELEDEIVALNTIRFILNTFIARLHVSINVNEQFNLFKDSDVIKVVESLSLSKINFKEERSMEDLNKANEVLSKLKDVRVLHLPPCTIASSHFIGENPELNAGNQLKDFILNSSLYQIKPDARVFGFNHPNPSQSSPYYGYEFWVTIPEDMEVSAPLQKKHFKGGLYAAHMIQMGNFNEWEWLCKWVEKDNQKYASNYSDQGEEIMGGCLEEHLNFVYDTFALNNKWPDGDIQLDLLTPIKLK